MYRRKNASRLTTGVFLMVAMLLSLVLTAPPAWTVEANTVMLGSEQLTIKQVVEVARHQATVSVPPAAMQRVDRGFNVVLEAAAQNIPVYGLTVGVGLK